MIKDDTVHRFTILADYLCFATIFGCMTICQFVDMSVSIHKVLQLPQKLVVLRLIIFAFKFVADEKCGPVNWNLVADIPPPYEPIWPAVTMVAFRTNILALVYLVLSSIWIVTSLMLIGE